MSPTDASSRYESSSLTGNEMKLQEFENDGTRWVLLGTFNDIQDQAEAEELVSKHQDGNKKFVLLDDEDDYEKEYLP